MKERGLDVDHLIVFRWVRRYAPEINKRIMAEFIEGGIGVLLNEASH